MLKQTVTYDDYNDVQQEETIYFNLTKTEVLDLMGLMPRLEAWQAKASGPDRPLTGEENLEFLDILKILIDKSYGVRSDDGKFFRKSEEILTDFKQSAVYDAFLFFLMTNQVHAINFMIEIMPKGINAPELDEARQAIRAELPAMTEAPTLSESSSAEIRAVEEEVPAWIREDREPTNKELMTMTNEQLRAEFQRKSTRS